MRFPWLFFISIRQYIRSLSPFDVMADSPDSGDIWPDVVFAYHLRFAFSFKDNSLKEWKFKKAITVQTYMYLHPVPVPLNLVSSLFMAIYWLICCLCCRKRPQWCIYRCRPVRFSFNLRIYRLRFLPLFATITVTCFLETDQIWIFSREFRQL